MSHMWTMEKKVQYIYRYDGFYIMSEAAIAKGAEPRIMVAVVDSDKYKFLQSQMLKNGVNIK